MTEEEKKYKILKKESYEELKEKENKKVTKSVFWTGFTSAVVLLSIFGINHFENPELGLYVGIVYSAYTVGNLKKCNCINL